MLFKRKSDISLNRVHAVINVVENSDRLKLVVNADPLRLTQGVLRVTEKLNAAVAEYEKTQSVDVLKDAAETYAALLFGKEQTEKLFDFYAGDFSCVINVCGIVFKDHLADKIAAMQKRMG